MTNDKTDKSRHRQDVALFRYRVIAPLLSLEAGSEAFRRTMKEQADRRWVIPGSSRRRVAANTIRGWLRIHRDHGFDGLLPKPRKDASKPRRMDVETIETLLTIKRDHPGLSVRKVIEKAREDGAVADDIPLPATTVHRLFSREGLMDMTDRVPVERRRFSYERAGELWMSDVLHGPRIRDDRTGRKRKTYLVSFIDDCSRVVPYSAFCFSESTPDFLQVLRQALMRRGCPGQSFTSDNGASYRSRQTSLVCAKLGIALIHARPRSPAGKGKIERYFRTLRGQFRRKHSIADDSCSRPRHTQPQAPRVGRDANTIARPTGGIDGCHAARQMRHGPATRSATPTSMMTSTTCSCSRTSVLIHRDLHAYACITASTRWRPPWWDERSPCVTTPPHPGAGL